MIKQVEQIAGAALMLLVLADVFLTVLYARAGTGLISRLISRLTLALFRRLSRGRGDNSGTILSFCGPAILVFLVLVWFFGLSLGAALIMHPRLGTSIKASSSESRTDFPTALYVGGNSISIVGSTNYAPRTGPTQMFFLLNSIVGTSMVSLTLTYLMQVYSALQRRNTVGLKLHLLSRETGDAAELLAGLGPRGHFDVGQNTISELADGMSGLKEAHHFYPVLFYFRFDSPFYSISRSSLTALDMVSLLKTTLSDHEYLWLKESGPIAQLWSSSLLLLRTLDETFVRDGTADRPKPSQVEKERAWRQRYSAAINRLGDAGIATTENPETGAEQYVALRREWDVEVNKLAAVMRLAPAEVDVALARLQTSSR